MHDKASLPNNNLAVTSAASAAVAWIIGALGSCALTFFFPLLSTCTWIVFLGASIIAVVTGYMARREIRESAGAQGGESLATVGIVAGWIGIGLNVIGLCLIVVFLLSAIFGLTLFGPQIGDVFSEIVRTLEAPQ